MTIGKRGKTLSANNFTRTRREIFKPYNLIVENENQVKLYFHSKGISKVGVYASPVYI